MDMQNNFNKQIGSRIRNMRESQGKTRDQIAEMAGISSQFLFYIETGKKSMTAKTIINLSKALNVTTDYILLGYANPMSKILINLEGLTQEQLNLVEKFLELFSYGAHQKNYKNKKIGRDKSADREI